MKNAVENTTATNVESLISEVADRFTEEVKQGLSPNVEQYAEQHPEIAGVIRQVFPALALLDASSSAVESQGNGDDAVTGRLGDFRILGELGRGGMAVVYEAEQISIGRRVALKVLPFAAMLDKQQLNRFKNEARAAGTLDHPNIVAVHSVGTERGVHYYAMQLIEGQSLAELIADLRASQGRAPDDDRPSTEPVSPTADTAREPQAAIWTLPAFDTVGYCRSVAQLGIQAAQALDHAHHNGIVHRDVKPGNLLVDADGKLWVTDFGLARIEADAGMTMTGDLLGTLRYMSPEQALAKRAVVDHRTDIYSLGATLYELLALRPIYSSSDRRELLNQIALEYPQRLTRVNAHVPVDLETIVAKALEKAPDDRYATAQELADDLRRFLSDETIHAKTPTLLGRAGKWSRRHRTFVWAAALVLLVALVASSVSTAMIAGALGRTRGALNQVRLERDAGYLNLYIAHMGLAQHDWENGLTSRLNQTLETHLPQPGRKDLRRWEWYFLDSVREDSLHTIGRGQVTGVDVDWRADGQQLVTAGNNNTVKIWNAITGEQVRTLKGHSQPILDVAWSPNGKRVASSSEDKTIKIWDAATGQDINTISTQRGQSKGICRIAWNPEGTHLASVDFPDTTIKVWQADTGQEVCTLTAPSVTRSIAWSPLGSRLASTGEGGWLCVWDAFTGEQFVADDSLREIGRSISWSRDGDRLAVGEGSGDITIRSPHTGEKLVELHGHKASVRCAAWCPTGRYLASSSSDETVKVWDSSTGDLVRTLYGHREGVDGVCWHPNGKLLASASSDGTLKIWPADGKSTDTVRLKHAGVIDAVAWNSDGNRLASLSREGTLKIWDAPDWHETITLLDASFIREGTHEKAHSLVWSSDDKTLATATFGNPTKVWDTISGEEVISIHDDTKCVAWSPDSEYLATGGSEGGTGDASIMGADIHLWRAATGEEIRTMRGHEHKVEALAWSHSGKYLASGSADKTVRIWTPNTGREVCTLRVSERYPRSISWRHDDRLITVAGNSSTVLIWNTEERREVKRLVGHSGIVESAVWSPDGQRIATASRDETIKIWDPISGLEIVTLSNHPGNHRTVAWSRDGQKLASGSTNGTIMIWDASRGYETAAVSQPDR